MLLAVVALLPIGTLVKYWFIKISHDNLSRFTPQLIAIDIVRWLAALLLMMLVLMVIYYYGPAIKQPLRLLTPGAAFVMIVWICLGLAFRFYIHTIGGKSYAKTYGTVGGVAIMLLLFYLDALVLLVGAEINSEIDFEVLKVKRGTRDFMGAEDEPQQGLFEEDGVTAVTYEWNVHTTRAWMNALAPIARPIFAVNHDFVMRNGGEGLARLLGTRLLALD